MASSSRATRGSTSTTAWVSRGSLRYSAATSGPGVAPFGIKVIVVEPSGFKTDWAGSSMIIRHIPAAYAQTVGAINTRLRRSPDGPAGDPARAGEVLVQVAKRHDIPYHLPLGVIAAESSIRLDEQLLAEDRKWRAVSRSADSAEPYPAEFPPDNADPHAPPRAGERPCAQPGHTSGATAAVSTRLTSCPG
jgi:hypothetical protein